MSNASGESAAQTLRPKLFFLAPLLSSFLLFPPNKGIVDTFASDHGLIAWVFWGLLLACALTALAFITASMRHPHWKAPSHRGLAIAGALYIATYLATLAALAFPIVSNPAVLFAFGLVQGIAVCFVLMAWVQLYVMDVRGLLINGAIVMALSIALSWFASWLFPVAGIMCMGAFAVISVAALIALSISNSPESSRPGINRPQNENKPENCTSQPLHLGHALKELLSIAWMPFAGALLGAWMVSSYTLTIDDFVVHSEFIGGLLAALIAILFCIPQYKTPYSILIDRIAIPALVGASIVLGSFPAGTTPFYLGAASVYAPIMFLSLYAMASLVSIVRAGELPLPFIFGVSLLCIAFAETAGTATGLIAADGNATGPMQWTMVSILFAAIVINSGYTAWKQAITTNDSTPLDEGGSAKNHAIDHAHEIRLAQIIEEHNLTKRESEVLDYLSRGYGSKFIANALFISDNTARTHVHNIYRKLGINSREELLSFFNE